MKIDDFYKSKITILEGINGCGKTRLLKQLEYHLSKDYNIIFFSDHRTMNFSKNDIDSIDIMLKLQNIESFKNRIEMAYNIQDPFALNDTFKGSKITCGYIQLLNFFYTIYIKISNVKKNIVIIDNIELSLHPLILVRLINDIIKEFNIHKLIISTHSHHLIQNYSTMKKYSSCDCEIVDVEKIKNDIFTGRLLQD